MPSATRQAWRAWAWDDFSWPAPSASLPSSMFYAIVGSLVLRSHVWVLFAASSISLVVILVIFKRLEARLAA